MSTEDPVTRERRQAQRVRDEKACVLDMAPDVARETLADTIGAIYCALDDMDEVPERLHPADVVSKHLQRGNMSGDGCDVVPRRPPREAPDDRSKLPPGIVTEYSGFMPEREPGQSYVDAWWAFVDRIRAPLLARIAELEAELEEVRDELGQIAEDDWHDRVERDTLEP